MDKKDIIKNKLYSWIEGLDNLKNEIKENLLSLFEQKRESIKMTK